MKRFSSSVSLAPLVSMCSPKEGKNSKNYPVYDSEFQAMLDSFDEEDCAEETGLITEKKKRLSFDQVKALERSFEIENKLEPERKVKIAEELGLKPRQVAIWFQNRRARWKTKQLERDYGILKANYDALKLDYESLEQEKEALVAELRELKAKLQGGNMELNQSVKEEALVSESENNVSEQGKNNGNISGIHGLGDFKDGSSDTSSSSLRLNCASLSSPSPMNWFPSKAFQHQFGRMEEQSFFSAEEPCNFFWGDQAPSLHWYFPDHGHNLFGLFRRLNASLYPLQGNVGLISLIHSHPIIIILTIKPSPLTE
ncbi:unnamed protein product, partial [Vitis vinifera]